MLAELSRASGLCAVLAAAGLAGCVSQNGTGDSSPAARGAPATVSPTRPPRARTEAPAAVADVGATAESADPVAMILAGRRRADFPELEFVDAGFTITEQVRIDNSARSDYETAIGLLRQDRLQQGIAMLRELTATTPDATAAWIDLGIAYQAVGDLEQAEQALTAAAGLSPDHPIVHNELGIVYRRTGRFADARASYEKALSVFAGFHYARRNLAVLCDLYLGDLSCALENYRAYLDSVGEDPEVEIWIADLENRTGN